jgi:ABC-type nitrate/sulfonate/bicarbonate transport system ATPase subunit/ABC-type nitrate/sulfonate/bicarbonate transport system permease component
MKNEKLIPTFLSVFFIAFGWQIISFSIGYPEIFPSLYNLVKKIFVLFSSPDFLIIIIATIIRGLFGFMLALILAFLIAVISNFSCFWKNFFNPIIVLTRSIPVVSFVLLAILWFTPTRLPVFIALMTMFPILVQNILTGLEQTDRKWIEMAQVFGKSKINQFFTIYLPASKSGIFDGISTAMGYGWRAIIIGEVLSQPVRGIGTAMKEAQAFFNVSEIIAWTVVIVLISYIFDLIIRKIQTINLNLKVPVTTKSDFIFDTQVSHNKEIRISNLNKKFNEIILFQNQNFMFENDKISFLKGPSGSGKTTLLRLVSGVEKKDSGEIYFSKKLSVSFAFQDFRLLPWLTVYENILYGIRKGKSDKNRLIQYIIEKLELLDQIHKYPHELSGGQQQRVSLARALVADPDILLLDEPLSGLDNNLKKKIIEFLSDWIIKKNVLTIWATHEQIKISEKDTQEIKL